MSEEYRRIGLITGTARRRHWSTEENLSRRPPQAPLPSLPALSRPESFRRSFLERPICSVRRAWWAALTGGAGIFS